MKPNWIITTCGNKKFQGAAKAKDFYIGSFVKMQGRVVERLQPKKSRIILSNKYGFMKPDTIIPGPYDSHWGYADSMKTSELIK